MAAKKTQYVVQHGGIMFGPRPELNDKGDPVPGTLVSPDRPLIARGELISEEEAGGPKALERLLAVGAVRPATRDEAAAGAAQPLHPGVQQALQTRQADMDRLRRDVGAMQDRLNAVLSMRAGAPAGMAAAAADPGPPDEEHVKAALAATDREYEELRAKAEALNEQLGRVHAEESKRGAGPKAPPGEELEGVPPPAEPPAWPAAEPEGKRHRGK